MQIASDAYALPKVDVDQLVSDVSSAPEGDGVFLTSTELAALLTEVAHIAGIGEPNWTQHLRWSEDNYANLGYHSVTFNYPTVHALYVALGGTDPYTVNGEWL
jgi:hypothetical protein